MQRLADLKEKRSTLDAEIRELETGLKDAYALTGMAGGWINTGQHRFRRAVTAGRRSLNRDALHEALTGIFRFRHLADIDVNALLSRCEREGAASSRLIITPVH